MKISKRKLKFRIIELLIIIITIILTVLSINYANNLRDVKGYGGEYIVPMFGIFSILIIEDSLKGRRK